MDFRECSECKQVFLGSNGLQKHISKGACNSDSQPSTQSTTVQDGLPEPTDEEPPADSPEPISQELYPTELPVDPSPRCPTLRRIPGARALEAFRSLVTIFLTRLADPEDSSEPQEVRYISELLFVLPVLLFDQDRKPLGARPAAAVLKDALGQPTHGDLRRLCEAKIKSWENPRSQHLSLQAPRQHILRSTIALCEAGRASVALKKLSVLQDGAKPAEVSADLFAELSELHPEADDRDAINLDGGGSGPGTPGFQLSPRSLLSALKNLPLHSSSGMDGWSYDLIRQVMLGDEALIQLCLVVFNRILAGNLPDAATWLTSRIIPLRKPSGGLRPIAIGSAWYRLLCRAVAAQVSKEMGSMLLPLQFGVGIKGGAESVVHSLQLHRRSASAAWSSQREEAEIAIAVDFRNAFNSIRRGAIAQQLQAKRPDLLPLFRWAYGTVGRAFLSSGEPVAPSATGVRQGDPLGPLFFCLGLHPLLDSTATRFPHVTVMAYMDDVHILGPQREAMRAFHWVRSQAPALLGLQLNQSKCMTWTPDSTVGLFVDDIPATSAGLTVLGSPVGSQDYEQRQVTQALTSDSAILPIVAKELPAHIAFKLLQACIACRPVFLARTVMWSSLSEAGTTFDAAIDQALQIITGSDRPLSRDQITIRSLPQTLGGLSCRRMQDLYGAAYAASFLGAIKKIPPAIWAAVTSEELLQSLTDDIGGLCQRIVPDFVAFTSQGAEFKPPGRHPDAGIRNLVHFAGQTDEEYARRLARWQRAPADNLPLEDGLDFGARLIDSSAQQAPSSDNSQQPTPESGGHGSQDPYSQKTLQTHKDLASFDSLLDSRLVAAPQEAAWLTSAACAGAAPWLSPTFVLPHQRMDHADFQDALRLRMLISPWNSVPPGCRIRCACDPTSSVNHIGLVHHAMTCPLLKGLRTSRHNAVRDLLAILLKGLPGTTAMATEQVIAAEVTGAPAVRVDILATIGTRTYYIDVCVATPTGEAYLRGGSAETAAVACKIRAEDKMRHWRRSMDDPATLRAFVPFIVEATGRVGAKARAFLDDLLQGVGSFLAAAPTTSRRPEGVDDVYQRVSNFKRSMGTTIASWNARMVRQLRSSCSLARLVAPPSQPAVPLSPSSPLATSSSHVTPATSAGPPPPPATSNKPRALGAASRVPVIANPWRASLRSRPSIQFARQSAPRPSRSSDGGRPARVPKGRRADACGFNLCDADTSEFCPGCKLSFCEAHRNASDHSCPRPGQAARGRAPTLPDADLFFFSQVESEADLDADLRAADPNYMASQSQDLDGQPPVSDAPSPASTSSPSPDHQPQELPHSPSPYLSQSQALHNELMDIFYNPQPGQPSSVESSQPAASSPAPPASLDSASSRPANTSSSPPDSLPS